jgi:N-acetylneuraminate synthase
MGIGVAVASVALGATVIEKHFTLNRSDGGVDSTFSMEPDEMRALVVESQRAWLAMGKINYGPMQNEMKSLEYRRSLYVVQDVKAGAVFSPENVRAIRPGHGLPPKYLSTIIGHRVAIDVKRGTPMAWALLG